jgi:hypothetical protein
MPMSWIDVTGYTAALAVLGAFCMTGIIPLRVLAIVSNILFAAYGILAHLYPVFLLHMVLLPINLGKLARLLQGERATRDAEVRRETPIILRRVDGALAEGIVDLAFREDNSGPATPIASPRKGLRSPYSFSSFINGCADPSPTAASEGANHG